MKVFLYYLNDILSTLEGKMQKKKLFLLFRLLELELGGSGVQNFLKLEKKTLHLEMFHVLNVQRLLINPQISQLLKTFSFKWIIN